MTKPEPTFGDVALYALLDAVPRGLRRLALAPYRPHRMFTEPREPIGDLHARLARRYQESRYGDDDQLSDDAFELVMSAVRATGKRPLLPVATGMFNLVTRLIDDNGLRFELPAFDPALAGNDAYVVPLRRRLDELEPYLLHEPAIREAFTRCIGSILTGIVDLELPEVALLKGGEEPDGPPPLLSVPLLALLSDPRQMVVTTITSLFADDNNDPAPALALAGTREQILRNVIMASKLTPEQASANPSRVVLPAASDLAPADLAKAYLAHTPFLDLLDTPVPFVIPYERRFEHTHIVAGTGHGKTQLLQTLMLADICDPLRPAVVAIDSQGDMIRTMSHLARFDPDLDDRLVILDPADIEWPLALNMFDVNRPRIDRLSRGAREQILAGIISLYDYIFGALLGAELTQKQSVVFRYIARLMIEIPEANIQTMRQLMEDPKPFRPFIARLSGTTRAFFENEFEDRSFIPTRQQIRRRLYGVLANPVFERMFSHPRNAFDMKAAMDSGKIVLISTAKDVLKDEASAIFGRYMIALVQQAALERAAEPEHRRHPAFVYIDEAADYFDQNIDSLLNQARKFKVGLILAHQHLDQLTTELRASMLTNPAVRLAGGVSQKDANALDGDMRTESDFLMGMRKRAHHTEFACFVRNMISEAIKLSVPLGRAEREPRMSDHAHAKLLARVRAEVAVPLDDVVTHIDGTTRMPASTTAEEFADRY